MMSSPSLDSYSFLGEKQNNC